MTKKLWNYIKENKLTSLLNLILLLILAFPFYYSYGNTFESDNLKWIPIYLIQSADFIFYIPLLFLTVGFQVVRSKKAKILLIKLIVILSFFYFIGTLLNIYSSFQDFYGGIGLLLILTLFPITIGILSFEHKKIK